MREWLRNTWKQTVWMQTLARKGSHAGRVELTDAVLTWTTCMSSFVALVTKWLPITNATWSAGAVLDRRQENLPTDPLCLLNKISCALTFCLSSQQTDESVWSAWGLECMKCVHYCNCFLKHKYEPIETGRRNACQNLPRNIKVSMSYFWS